MKKWNDDEEPYMRIACRSELEFYINLVKHYGFEVGFNDGTIEKIEEHRQEKKKYGL